MTSKNRATRKVESKIHAFVGPSIVARVFAFAWFEAGVAGPPSLPPKARSGGKGGGGGRVSLGLRCVLRRPWGTSRQTSAWPWASGSPTWRVPPAGAWRPLTWTCSGTAATAAAPTPRTGTPPRWVGAGRPGTRVGKGKPSSRGHVPRDGEKRTGKGIPDSLTNSAGDWERTYCGTASAASAIRRLCRRLCPASPLESTDFADWAHFEINCFVNF